MSSKAVSAEPQLLPSPPPSPTPSDTPTERGPDHISKAHLNPESSTFKKGKGRMLDNSIDSQQSDPDDASEEYPPDENETKRIEETLRKWETEERERRRVARESGTSSKYSVRGVTRTASLILAGLGIQRPRSGVGGGGGHHHALPENEHEDGMPLEDLDRTPPPSGANTPTLRQRFHAYYPNSGSTTTTTNPFENPSNVLNASTSSLNTPDHPTILTESSGPHLILSSPPRKKQRGAPPPEPLGLPKPRTPPPRPEDQAYVTQPPDHMASPSTTAKGTVHSESDEPEKEVRWWTEWMCGCSEGPDRGGYNQSGRTNPNE